MTWSSLWLRLDRVVPYGCADDMEAYDLPIILGYWCEIHCITFSLQP